MGTFPQPTSSRMWEPRSNLDVGYHFRRRRFFGLDFLAKSSGVQPKISVDAHTKCNIGVVPPAGGRGPTFQEMPWNCWSESFATRPCLVSVINSTFDRIRFGPGCRLPLHDYSHGVTEGGDPHRHPRARLSDGEELIHRQPRLFQSGSHGGGVVARLQAPVDPGVARVAPVSRAGLARRDVAESSRTGSRTRQGGGHDRRPCGHIGPRVGRI
jgi:hypothetical protein